MMRYFLPFALLIVFVATWLTMSIKPIDPVLASPTLLTQQTVQR